ncbi:MAG: hypothetical protein R3D90_15855 [Paracoccaceae bacterium]
MMDLAQPDQFDLDRLAEDLGRLPDAPLAMPLQQLESAPRRGGLMALLRPGAAWLRKAGH